MTSWTTLTIAAPSSDHNAIAASLETHSDEDAFTIERDNANTDTVNIRFSGLESDAALRVLAIVSDHYNFLYGVITAVEDTRDNASVTVYKQTDGGLEQDFAHLFPGNPRGGLSNIAVALAETHCVNVPTEP